MKIRDLIDIDIEIYKEEDEFELVQALTDIKEEIAEIYRTPILISQI